MPLDSPIDEASGKYFVGQDTSPIRKPARDQLRQDLRVEDEIVVVQLERDGEQDAAGRTRDSRCGHLGQLAPKHQILKERQRAIDHVFEDRHAARQRLAAENPRAEHRVVDAEADRRSDRDHQARVVLVVRMQHHDHVRARSIQRHPVAGLLVAAIPQVLFDAAAAPVRVPARCRRWAS